MNEKEQRYSLPESTLNTILQYLGTKPYNEVAQMINDVHKNIIKIEATPEPVTTALFDEES